MKIIRVLLLLGFLCAWPAHADDAALLTINTQQIHAEVAATPATRAHGLMGRGRLCANCGMLFVFPIEGHHGFWMKDTPLPLSIAFVARNGRVINIDEMQAYTLDVHFAEGDALYALEMRGGWFEAHGVKPGDRLLGIPRTAPNEPGAE